MNLWAPHTDFCCSEKEESLTLEASEDQRISANSLLSIGAVKLFGLEWLVSLKFPPFDSSLPAVSQVTRSRNGASLMRDNKEFWLPALLLTVFYHIP